MQETQSKTFNDVQKRIESGDVRDVKVGIFDLDCVMRGKYVSAGKLKSALKGGVNYCNVLFGWDSSDKLYEGVNTTFSGWDTGFPDVEARLLPETTRLIPYENDTPFILAEFTGEAEKLCPRGTLRRVLKRAEQLGFAASAACEYEFFIFDETPDTVREKNYRNLNNMTPGSFGYSVIRNSVHSELYHYLLDLCHDMDIPLEGLHTETGPGVIEAAITVDSALQAADKAALFKTFVKAGLQRQGLMPTFMPKWSVDEAGQSGHLHISLQKLDGSSAFYDDSQPDNFSETMRHFIGGQQALMPELFAMIAPTVNAYRRLVPGFWAPTSATWGIENRTCALRAIPGSEKSQRVEYRITGSDINPYVALAAAIGSGIWGIENKIEPTAPMTGNAYEAETPKNLDIPLSLDEAADRLAASEAAKDLFGAEFAEHFAATRHWEVREFNRAVTDWELQRYFEII